jgi:hypothetical protein
VIALAAANLDETDAPELLFSGLDTDHDWSRLLRHIAESEGCAYYDRYFFEELRGEA